MPLRERSLRSLKRSNACSPGPSLEEEGRQGRSRYAVRFAQP